METPRGRLGGGVIVSEGHLASLIEKFSLDETIDAYIQPNPIYKGTLTGARADASKVAEARWFLVDIDPLYDGRKTFPLIDRSITNTLTTFDQSMIFNEIIRPTVHVFSGRGYQVWFSLKNPISFAPGEVKRRQQVEWANRKVLEALSGMVIPADEWKIDILPDLPRLMRMPGTINRKTGLRSTLDSIFTVGWVDIDAAIEWAGSPPAPPERQIVPGKKWQSVLALLPPTVRNYIIEGVEGGERHKKSFAAASALRDAAIPYEGALAAVLRGAHRCAPPIDTDTTFTTRSVTKMVQKVYNGS